MGSDENSLLVLEGIKKIEATSLEQLLTQILSAQVGVNAGR